MRRVHGWLRMVAWALLLQLNHAPWSGLGGLVDERLRWLERFLLGTLLIAGTTAGAFGRAASAPGRGRCHARLLRVALLPQAALSALLLVWLLATGRNDAVGVVTVGFLAWSAGFDVAFVAWPQARGRHYRFRGAILREGDASSPGAEPRERPPWERC